MANHKIITTIVSTCSIYDNYVQKLCMYKSSWSYMCVFKVYSDCLECGNVSNLRCKTEM